MSYPKLNRAFLWGYVLDPVRVGERDSNGNTIHLFNLLCFEFSSESPGEPPTGARTASIVIPIKAVLPPSTPLKPGQALWVEGFLRSFYWKSPYVTSASLVEADSVVLFDCEPLANLHHPDAKNLQPTPAYTLTQSSPW